MKSRQRVMHHGDVFTPLALVNDVRNLVSHECQRIDSRFLEPACGNGNFLAEVLRRKLATLSRQNPKTPNAGNATPSSPSPAFTASTPDNIDECRERLLLILTDTPSGRRSTIMPLS